MIIPTSSPPIGCCIDWREINQGLVTNHPWDWYLKNAYETSMAMTKFAGEYAIYRSDGRRYFSADSRRSQSEGWKMQADDLESNMRARADRWMKEAYPFGSEMPWDSTGQEEVYAWTKYFGYNDKADVRSTRSWATIPRFRTGDTTAARGATGISFWRQPQDRRLERQLHHYGSGLNAIPVLANIATIPTIFISARGLWWQHGSRSLISIRKVLLSRRISRFPDMLRTDPVSGDYGPNFFGHAWNTATYLVRHPEFGWVAFGGNVKTEGDVVKVTPLDAYRGRIYVASAGLWLTLDSGKFESLEFNSKTRLVRVELAPASRFTPTARLRIEQPSKISNAGKYHPSQTFTQERDAYVVRLAKTPTWVELRSK